MSSQALMQTIALLPYSLAEQVRSYANSVDGALEDIFNEAKVDYSPQLAESIVFLAGIRKLFSIVESQYWLVDNSTTVFSHWGSQATISIGSTNFNRGGAYHRELRELMEGLREILSRHGVFPYIDGSPSYAEVLRLLANEH